MNKQRIVKIGLALVLAAAAGFYLERGPRSPDTTAVTGAGEGEVLRLLRQPRSLPDIGFADGDGRPTRLSNFRGKVILLNIWATWCVPCRKEMPALDRLQASLGGPDFEVLALSVDRDGLPAAKAFYLQTGIRQLRVYIDQSGQALSDLGATAIPTTLLIDRHGNEIGRKIGPAEWDGPALIKVISDHLDTPAKPAELSGKSTNCRGSVSVSTLPTEPGACAEG
jgi:thiol-disulfide isomerase/thioredoxin